MVFRSTEESLTSVRSDVCALKRGCQYDDSRAREKTQKRTGGIILEHAQDAQHVTNDESNFGVVDEEVGTRDSTRSVIPTEKY